MFTTSPAFEVLSVPSSIRIVIVPESWCWKCAAWQLFVLAIGLTQVDHFQPGSNVARPTTAPATVTSSTLPLSNFRIYSGEFKLFISNVLALIGITPPRAVFTQR
jgi:hypothetical protein